MAQKDATINTLTTKLLQTKDQLEMVNLQLKVFNVKIIKLLTRTDATVFIFFSFLLNQQLTHAVFFKLTLQKNPSNGLLTLCIQPLNGKAKTMPLESLLDVRPDKEDVRKFSITFTVRFAQNKQKFSQSLEQSNRSF